MVFKLVLGYAVYTLSKENIDEYFLDMLHDFQRAAKVSLYIETDSGLGIHIPFTLALYILGLSLGIPGYFTPNFLIQLYVKLVQFFYNDEFLFYTRENIYFILQSKNPLVRGWAKMVKLERYQF